MTPAEVLAVLYAQRAKAQKSYGLHSQEHVCWSDVCAAVAALVAENARLREALRMMLRGTQEDCGRVCVPSDAAVRAAFAALAGAVHD